VSECCAKCFHCKGTLPDQPLVVDVGGQAERVCSADCANTIKDIIKSGLGDFYKHRETPGNDAAKPHKPVEHWETFERPAVMREFVREGNNGELVADLLVQGVHCAACTWLIENTLGKVAGVKSIEVNPVTTRGELCWNPQKVHLADLLRKIEHLGYTPVPFTEHQAQLATEQEKRLTLRRLLVAGLGMMQVVSYAIAMYAGAFQGMDPDIQEFFRLISLVVATPVVLYSGAPFFTGAWRNIRSMHMGMDVPVALAIGAAWLASVWNTFAGSGEVFFDSATMFVFFLSGTRYLEAAGRHRAFDLTHSLAQHIPCTAMRLTESGREEVGVMELEPGDIVLVAQGMAFPADGMLLAPSAQIDEAMLTGESVPVRRAKGDAVAAGTVNAGTAVNICVDKIGADTVIAQIGRLVTQAGHDKPRLAQLTDRIAAVFVTAVLLIAVLTGIVWWQTDPSRAFEIVLTVLVVSCPCALALATPAALAVATSTLARQGFLIRHGDALQVLAKVEHFVFDKTGTLTDNALEIQTTAVRNNISAEQARAIAASLETSSAHPIARAFRSTENVKPATQLNTFAGGGLEGRIQSRLFRIGTLEFVTELAPDKNDGESELGKSNPEQRNVFLGDESGLLARFEISEHLREGAIPALDGLRSRGISVTIASGDQPVAVERLADRIGVTDWRAGMLPDQKLALVRELQAAGTTVAAVGDGINDSPVLAGADVSIAMGSGTTVAQHSADCVWLGTQLNGLDAAVAMANKAIRVVRQNLAWALCYNLLAIPLAMSGLIVPWMAALGMSLSSIFVMFNALRLGTAVRPLAPPATKPANGAAQPELELAT